MDVALFAFWPEQPMVISLVPEILSDGGHTDAILEPLSTVGGFSGGIGDGLDRLVGRAG